MFMLPEITYWSISTSCALMILFIPCKPPLLGAFLLCGREWSSPVWKWFWTTVLALLEFIVAMKTLICGGHYGAFTHISGQALLLGRYQDFLNSKNTKMDFLVKGYREIQVREKMHNSSYRGRILLIFIFAVPSFQILSGFGLISLTHKAKLIQILAFLVTYVDVIVLGMAVLSFASFIFIKSEDWIKKMKGKKNSRYFRRVHKSFRPLRLEYGNNFVDRTTPLVIQEFCISQTASAVLLNKT